MAEASINSALLPFFLRESALLPFVFLEFFFLAVFVSDVPFDFVSSKYVASSL
jgi:hypothetical protein